MSVQSIDTLAAEAEATSSRIRTGFADLRRRTDPKHLAEEAIDLARTQGEALVDRARGLTNNHPLALGAGVAAIGLALLTRHKLSNARVDLGDGASDYTDYDDSYEPQPLLPDVGQSVGRNPLLSVLLGLAAGALIGALLPTAED